jgi:phosphatidylglycerol:prolipoprotein diacylglycerol transferase
MYPVLLHIWGPFAVHSYGAMIALGALITLVIMQRDKKLMQAISEQELTELVTVLILAGVVFGRLLHIIENFDSIHSVLDAINITDAGFSLLGTVLGGACAGAIFLYRKKLDFFAIADRVTIYIPLMYSISRIGCFLAGCCYGQETTSAWSIVYRNTDVFAPCFIHLHPTQLYSSAAGLVIFLCMYFIADHVFKKPGQLFGCYFIATGLERFCIDFLRADRSMLTTIFSTSQMISIVCIVIGVLLFNTSKSRQWLTNNTKKQS